jgi:hypothetical protein
MIAQYLVDLVDEAGYISGELAEAAEKLGAPLTRVERVLVGQKPPALAGLAADIYFVHVMTRKSLGLMTRKLSVTESHIVAQFRGTF